MRQSSALSFCPSNLASTVEPRGSGAAMSPFPLNPSPQWAADRPGLGLLPPELPLRARCQLQSPPFPLSSLERLVSGNQDSHGGYPSLAV